jgi:exosortase
MSIASTTRPNLNESRPIAVAATSQRDRASWLGLSIGLVVLAIAYGPLLWLFFRQQWQKPHYQFFPFVIAAFAWLFWHRYTEGTPACAAAKRPSWAVHLLQVTAFLVLLFALVIRSPWCAMVSLIVLTASTFLSISGVRRVVNLWGIWLLLWLLVPAPFNLDQKLITKLQFVSSRLSSFVLDALSIQHLMEGNTLWLRAKQLFVDEACSGIISMLSIVACAVIYAVFKNRSPLHLALLALASIAWATLLNVLRISTIAYALDVWGVDWSVGAPHEILSLVLFLVAFLALLCTDQILIVCLAPIVPAWNEYYGHDIRFGKRLAASWDWLTTLGQPSNEKSDEIPPANMVMTPSPPTSGRSFRWILPSIFAPLAAIQSVLLVYAFQVAPERLSSVQTAIEFGESAMPSMFCGMSKVGFEPHKRSADNIQGKYSRTYIYHSADGTNYMLSFDFPFPGYWHELTECYVATGWKPIDRQIVSNLSDEQLGQPWKYVEATFAKSEGQIGTLCFSEFDQFGMPYEPQSDWLREGGSFWPSRTLYLKERQIFQVQVWSEGTSKLTSEQRLKGRELLLQARQRFRTLVVKHSEAATAAPAVSAHPVTAGGEGNR